MKNIITYYLIFIFGILGLGSRAALALEVKTGEATDITSNSAVVHGTISGVEMETIRFAGFNYGRSIGIVEGVVDAQETGDNEVSGIISGLLSGTTYYYELWVVTWLSTDIYYGGWESFTTLSGEPTPTPTPRCEVVSIEVFPESLTFEREQSDEVTVTLKGNDCIPINEMVTAKIKSGKKRVSVSPLIAYTDIIGQAVFTITAKNKTGKAKVTFKADNLKETIIVKIRK